jgi:DNA-binding PadR family transcriptional regulator
VPVHHAVLALLAEGDSHGYELRNAFHEAVGPQWGEVNIGHLYQVLERLVRDEMVVGYQVEQRKLPDRVVYRLTDKGREELDRWLATPFVRQTGYRDDFFLKIMAAARLGKASLDKTLKIQREAYLGELSSLASLRSSHKDEPLVSLLLDAAISHTKVQLKIAEEAEAMSDRLVQSSGGTAPATAVKTERTSRGRTA